MVVVRVFFIVVLITLSVVLAVDTVRLIIRKVKAKKKKEAEKQVIENKTDNN